MARKSVQDSGNFTLQREQYPEGDIPFSRAPAPVTVGCSKPERSTSLIQPGKKRAQAPMMSADSNDFRKEGRLSANVVHANVRRLLDLHRQLEQTLAQGGALRRKPTPVAEQQGQLRRLVLWVSTLRERAAPLLSASPKVDDGRGPFAGIFKTELLQALRRRVRRLGSAPRKRRREHTRKATKLLQRLRPRRSTTD